MTKLLPPLITNISKTRVELPGPMKLGQGTSGRHFQPGAILGGVPCFDCARGVGETLTLLNQKVKAMLVEEDMVEDVPQLFVRSVCKDESEKKDVPS